MKKITYSLALAVLVALAGLFTTIEAQPYRSSHEEVKKLLERIEQGTDVFRNSLKEALDKSRLDDTKREDNINQFVKEFEQATDRLKDRYSDKSTAVVTVEEVLQRGTAIDNFVERHWLSQRAQRAWGNLYRDLNELARAYGVGWDWSSPTTNPYRVSQQEMKKLMERIEKHSDNFRASLDEALDKSHFDGSKREDNINNFVKDFEVATDNLKDRFSDDYSAVGAASEVLRRSARIDNFMQRHALTPRAKSDWGVLRADLDELARAYNVSMSWNNWIITIP
jgi:hypothetical protein